MGKPIDYKQCHCMCWKWSGEYCTWLGPIEEMVVVEFIPEEMRADLKRAGITHAVFPCEGSMRVAVEKTCADDMLKFDSDWVVLLKDEKPEDYYVEPTDPRTWTLPDSF